jgi:ADP-heptose:LPS heptosyltransferase
MKDNHSEWLFRIFSLMTDYFPRSSARFLDMIIINILGHRSLQRRENRLNRATVARTPSFSRILVICDLNIGDAMLIQPSVAALRDIFPEAVIDYAITRSAAGLVYGNPDISTLFPIFVGAPYPLGEDFHRLGEILRNGQYDFIMNFCPHFHKKWLHKYVPNVLGCRLLAQKIFADLRTDAKINVAYRSNRYIYEMFSEVSPSPPGEFPGISITISSEAIDRAERFLSERGLLTEQPIIFYNPDASSRFTIIPFNEQVSLLTKLAELPYPLLLAAGHTFKKIELKLLSELAPRLRDKVTIVPASIPIDSYAAIVDFCSLFVTPDTAQLHIAAARKIAAGGGTFRFHNHTAVFGVFGATPPRLYGYDSRYAGFISANQDAPSHTYVAPSPCRNLTCTNKKAKTCRKVRCFERLDIERICRDAAEYLAKLPTAAPVARAAHRQPPRNRIYRNNTRS